MGINFFRNTILMATYNTIHLMEVPNVWRHPSCWVLGLPHYRVLRETSLNWEFLILRLSSLRTVPFVLDVGGPEPEACFPSVCKGKRKERGGYKSSEHSTAPLASLNTSLIWVPWASLSSCTKGKLSMTDLSASTRHLSGQGELRLRESCFLSTRESICSPLGRSHED